MGYQPQFMTDVEGFRRDLRQVKTPADWKEFQTKWFADEKLWPDKTAQQQRADAKAKVGPERIAGHRWFHSSFVKDITPEARHELFTALQIGLEAMYPRPADERRNAETVWRRHCYHCEIGI